MVHHHDIERYVSLGCYPRRWLVLELVMSRASLGGLWLRHSETVCEVSKADILSPGRFSGIHFALGYMIVL